jgi:hypothetical protein
MLDFLLVLGQIPGTNLQITFNEIAIFTAAVLSWYFRRQLRDLAIREYRMFITYIKLRYYLHRQLKLPV